MFGKNPPFFFTTSEKMTQQHTLIMSQLLEQVEIQEKINSNDTQLLNLCKTHYIYIVRHTHIIYQTEDEKLKEGNVLFNDALNTFYLRLYGVRHMVKDHSDSEKGNPLPTHRLLFPISSKGYFICTIPQTG